MLLAFQRKKTKRIMRLDQIKEFIHRHPLLFLTLAGVLLTLPMLAMAELPQRDVLFRYAPMAQAIADGDWAIAFHPRIPPLLPVLGAIVILGLGCSAFAALKLVSAASFVLTLLPLWGIFRRVFNSQIAVGGCIFYLFCSYLLRQAPTGLRESTKCFFLVLMTYAIIRIFQERRRLGSYLLFGAAAAAMGLTRDDSILYAMLIGLFIAGLETVKLRAFPWRSSLAALTALLIFCPYLLYNYAVTGFPVPGIRAVRMVSPWLPKNSFGKLEYPQKANATPPLRPLECKAALPPLKAGETPEGTAVKPAKAPSKPLPLLVHLPPDEESEDIPDFLSSLVKGAYFFFSLPALAIILWRIYRRRWTRAESILLALFLGHTLIILLQIIIVDHKLYVSRRYLLPAVPLIFGWTAMAAWWIHRQLLHKLPPNWGKWVFAILCIAAGIGLYIDALMPQIKMYSTSKRVLERQAAETWAEFIRNDYHGSRRPAGHKINIHEYRTFFRPTVACAEIPALGYLAGGEGFDISAWECITRKLPADYLVGAFRGKEEIPKLPGYEQVKVLRRENRGYVLWRRTQ